MKVFLLGEHGKVGSVLGPALEEAGHELVGSAAGIGPSETRFRRAIEHVNPALAEREAA